MCKRTYPDDWTSRKLQAQSTKQKKEKAYELELIEFDFSQKEGSVLLMVPGYFQNAFVFDLMPEHDVSIARHIAKTFGLHIYVLHPNGIGGSDYIRKSDLDDIAIDDIHAAIEVLKASHDKPLYVMGHSNGSITLQTYMAGLSREDNGNTFNPLLASQRQENIDGMILFAGNVCMTDDDENSELKKTSKFGTRITFFLKTLGWINACLLTKVVSPTKIWGRLSVAFWKLWKFLYHIENVTKEAKKELYNRTLDGTSAATLIQYSHGVLGGCIQTTAGVNYFEGLKHIHIPTVQVTFGLDPLAVPGPTKRDNFDRIGSHRKQFFAFDNQGHEDFMMVKEYHEFVNEPFEFLINQT